MVSNLKKVIICNSYLLEKSSPEIGGDISFNALIYYIRIESAAFFQSGLFTDTKDIIYYKGPDDHHLIFANILVEF